MYSVYFDNSFTRDQRRRKHHPFQPEAPKLSYDHITYMPLAASDQYSLLRHSLSIFYLLWLSFLPHYALTLTQTSQVQSAIDEVLEQGKEHIQANVTPFSNSFSKFPFNPSILDVLRIAFYILPF